MNNKDVAAILREIGTYKEILAENPFKTRAFHNAARTLETLTADVHTLVKEGTLIDVKGIGKALVEVIEDILEHGESAELTRLKQIIPQGIPEILELPGMGPKKVRAIWQNLDITTIGELEYACRENRLIILDGFGEKTQANILKGIEYRKKFKGVFLFHEALATAEEAMRILTSSGRFDSVVLAGSLRRGKKFTKDADILVIPKPGASHEDMEETLLQLADNREESDGIISRGETKVSIRRNGLQIDFRIIPAESFGSAYQHFTGSKEHNTRLRTRAKSLGLKMNEYGVFRDETPVASKDEAEVYASIKLPFIPPELREGQEEIEAAESGTLPPLVQPDQVKGIIHVHSIYSDGVNTIAELAEDCIKRGYEFLCISDHSQSAGYAHGLSEKRLEDQHDEIRRLNEEHKPFRIFHGIESDILTDGSLDYPDDVLAHLDFVIGSIHSKLTMNREEATQRLVRAIDNPFITILGHISGRILLSREGYAYDEETILAHLKSNRVAIELNCNPHRLDPDWEFLKKAKAEGILISLSPDAHSFGGFDDIRFGVMMARKAWLAKSGILNCMTGDEIDDYFKKRKQGKSA